MDRSYIRNLQINIIYGKEEQEGNEEIRADCQLRLNENGFLGGGMSATIMWSKWELIDWCENLEWYTKRKKSW